MKLVEELNYCDKGHVFNKYARIVYNFKDYEKITKKKMMQEIIDAYNNNEEMISELVSKKERDFLIYFRKLDTKQMSEEWHKKEDLLKGLSYGEKMKHSPLAQLNQKYWWEIRELRDKCLLSYDFANGTVYVPEELEKVINQYLDKPLHPNKKNVDQFISLALGFLKRIGEIPLDIFVKIIKDITGIKEETILGFLHSYVGHFYTYIYEKEVEDIDKSIPMICFSEYYQYLEELDAAKKDKAYSNNQEVDYRSFEKIFNEGFDTTIPSVRKMMKELLKDDANNATMLFENIDQARLLGTTDEVDIILNLFLTGEEEEKEKKIELIHKALEEMPSAAYGGLAPKVAKRNIEEREAYHKKRIDEYTPQGDACLGEEEAAQFYRVYMALLEYVNQKYRIVWNCRLLESDSVDPADISEISEYVFRNPKKIIKEYVKANPFGLSKEDLGITKGFVRGKEETFILHRFEENYTVFCDDYKSYMVKGLVDNIDEIIDPYSLPTVVRTVLLPYKNGIVFNGVISDYQFGHETMPIEALENLDTLPKIYKL
ncbi:MAG: hypothetical protein IJ875_01565 [Solobacterium sp.]|nr:hypothetical protein [Solobacterium sp.]